MKILLLILISLTSVSALADQCSFVTLNQALGAADLIDSGDYVMSYCEPCGDTQGDVFQVESVDFQMVNSEFVEPGQYYQLLINGKTYDLAYLFLETKPQYADDDYSVYTNVSKLVDCSSEDVSTFIYDSVHE